MGGLGCLAKWFDCESDTMTLTMQQPELVLILLNTVSTEMADLHCLAMPGNFLEQYT